MARHSFVASEQFEAGKGREVRVVDSDAMDRLLNSDRVESFRSFPNEFYHVWFVGENTYVVYEVVDQ